MSGMHVELDEFTSKDRRMLRDLQHREEARSYKVAMEVGDGTIVQSREKREIFTFSAPDIGTVIFDVRSIKDAIIDGEIPATMYRIDGETPEHFYQHILHNNGVDPERLAQFSGRDLKRPGIMVMWPHGESSMIDGNHRLCRRYELKVPNFRFLMIEATDCLRYMCRPGEEKELFERDRVRPAGYELLHSEVRQED